MKPTVRVILTIICCSLGRSTTVNNVAPASKTYILTFYPTAEKFLYQKIGTNNFKEAANSFEGETKKGILNKLSAYTNYVNSLPTYIQQEGDNIIDITIKQSMVERKKRETKKDKMIHLSTLKTGQRIKYTTFKGANCKQQKINGSCIVSFIKKIKNPKHLYLGDEITNATINFLKGDTYPFQIKDLAAEMRTKNDKDILINTFIAIQLNTFNNVQNTEPVSSTTIAPVSPSTVSTQTSSSLTPMEKLGVGILTNEKLILSNKKEIKKDDYYDLLTLSNTMERYQSFKVYEKFLFHQSKRYLLIGKFKLEENLILKYRPIKLKEKATIFKGFHTGLVKQDCCFISTMQQFLKTENDWYNIENCNTIGSHYECINRLDNTQLKDTCLYNNQKCLKRIKCSLTQLPLYYSDIYTVNYIPSVRTVFSIYTLKVNTHYRISSKRTEFFSLEGQQITLQGLTNLTNSFEIQEIKFPLENLCKVDQIPWYQITTVSNAFCIGAASLSMTILCICYACTRKKKNTEFEAVPMDDRPRRRVVFRTALSNK